jgi:hydrogenase 3 maturation protease
MSGHNDGIKNDIKGRIRGVVAIIGIGNIMRGDDGFGPKIIELLSRKQATLPEGRQRAHLFDCGTVPENYIFPILSTSCETIILVDAADFGAKAGTIKTLALEEISASGISTHNSSIRLFTDLLMTGRGNLNIFAVSIQPKKIAFGDSLSDEVRLGIDELAGIFAEALA